MTDPITLISAYILFGLLISFMVWMATRGDENHLGIFVYVLLTFAWPIVMVRSILKR